jgi:adhesin HecA-like repeat protein
VDATRLSAPTFAVEWVGANYSAGLVQQFWLLPATYRLASGNVWTDARLTVTRAGTVDYPAGAGYLSGRGGTTLVARGVEISVDARRLTSARFSIAWVGSNYDARQVQVFRLLPSTYRLGDGAGWSSARFTATAAGTVDYEAAATYFSGRGTPTLTILTNTLP